MLIDLSFAVWGNHPSRSSWIIIMPPRLNRRQLREQEELSALSPASDGYGIDFEGTRSGADKATMVRFAQVIVWLRG